MKYQEKYFLKTEVSKLGIILTRIGRKNRNLEQKLPGIDYTPEQLFWIASAQIYCSKDRPEEIIRRAAVNEHGLEQFYVIGSFQNLPEFSQDFKCPLGSFMNPVEKCQIF